MERINETIGAFRTHLQRLALSIFKRILFFYSNVMNN